MLRKNINVGLIHANTAAYVINIQGMCTNAHFQRQMTYNLNKNTFFMKVVVLHWSALA